MTQKSGNKVFGLLAMGLLFLSVACSHNRPSVSKLEGLSEDVAQQEEVAKADVVAPAAQEEAAPETSPVDNDFSVPSNPATTEAKPEQNGIEAEVKSEAAVKEEGVVSDEVAVKEEPAVKEEALAQNEFSVPVTSVDSVKVEAPVAEAPALVATQNESDFAAQVQSDLDSVGRKKKKHRKWKKNLETNLSALNEAVVPQEAKKELASANVSNLIERNLLWFALAIVGGLISAFLTVRRSRKSSDTNT